MRTGLLILLISFFTVGCKSKTRVPHNVISQKKMQVILWDMMRADQFLADYVLNKDTSLNKTTESLKYYQQIFAIHKISKEEFQHSLSFYRSQPALLRVIMDSISTPPKDVVPQPAKPDSVKISPVLIGDTVIKSPPKNIQDTAIPKKRKLKLQAI